MYTHDKDDDTKVWKFDWAPLENSQSGASSNWLDRTSSPVVFISSYLISADTGLTVANDTKATNDTQVQFTLDASAATTGEKYKVTCQITASDGQKDTRSMLFYITDN